MTNHFYLIVQPSSEIKQKTFKVCTFRNLFLKLNLPYEEGVLAGWELYLIIITFISNTFNIAQFVRIMK